MPKIQYLQRKSPLKNHSFSCNQNQNLFPVSAAAGLSKKGSWMIAAIAESQPSNFKVKQVSY